VEIIVSAHQRMQAYKKGSKLTIILEIFNHVNIFLNPNNCFPNGWNITALVFTIFYHFLKITNTYMTTF
jgi:hypothetical protein